MTIFLGIDPGLRQTGWGIIAKNISISYIASGIIKTISDEKISSHRSDPRALGLIYNGIQKIIVDYKVSQCAIENTYVNSNPISSLKLAQARAAAIVACYNNGCMPYEYPASTIKKTITGKGNADKLQVQKMIQIQLGYVGGTQMDETDAIAIAMCHALQHKFL
jgi:crossover junction endodeoxyribonuclease RuvC